MLSLTLKTPHLVSVAQDEGGNLEGLSNYLSTKHAQERRRAQLGGADYTNVSDLFYQ